MGISRRRRPAECLDALRGHLWFSWEARRPLTTLARLHTTPDEGPIEPAVLDRVWQGIQQVRPAGARVLLAVDEQVVRGG